MFKLFTYSATTRKRYAYIVHYRNSAGCSVRTRVRSLKLLAIGARIRLKDDLEIWGSDERSEGCHLERESALSFFLALVLDPLFEFCEFVEGNFFFLVEDLKEVREKQSGKCSISKASGFLE